MVIDLMVHCRYVQIPMIGVRPTEFADGIPSVSVSVDQARATLVLDACVPGNLDRYPLFSGSMDILLSDEPPNASDLMISSSPYQEEVRDKVHAIYHLLYTRYEYFIRKAGSIRYTTPDVPLTLASLFSQIQDWKYRIGDEHWKQFPKQPKEIGLNPLFVDDQLIGKDRWNSIKAAIESTTKVDQLELELERIRSRLHWGYRRFATIEAAIVIEILLNEYAMRQLQNKGFSKTKLGVLDDHFSFSGLVNLVVPLLLSEEDNEIVSDSLHSIDRLRKVRNKIVHDGLSEDVIPTDEVDSAIDAILRLGARLRSPHTES